MAQGKPFSIDHFLVRWLACLFLVFVTYNPSRYSYVHWVLDEVGRLHLKVAVGIAILIAYMLVLRVVFASIGRLGVLAGGFCALLVCIEVIRLKPAEGRLQWMIEIVLLIALATLTAIGVSWSDIIMRLTGQKQKRYLHKNKVQR